jgi:hypothetical protein
VSVTAIDESQKVRDNLFIDNAAPRHGATMMTEKTFRPTSNQIKAAQLLLIAMAHERTIRPIVEGYMTEILAKGQWRRRADFVGHGLMDEVILDHKLSYHLSDEDAAVFFAECRKARDAAGLKVENPEFCPLCVAEHTRVQAENLLMNRMSETPRLEYLAKSYLLTLDERAKVIDLSLKMLAPYVGDTAADVLKAA